MRDDHDTAVVARRIVLAVPPERVRDASAKARRLIDKACDPFPEADAERFIAEAECRRAVLWLVAEGVTIKGICFTRMEDRKDGRTVVVSVIGLDDLGDAALLKPRLMEFARAEGAGRISMTGRRGWGRLFGVKLEPRWYGEMKVA